jgi:hypothetical protein
MQEGLIIPFQIMPLKKSLLLRIFTLLLAQNELYRSSFEANTVS